MLRGRTGRARALRGVGFVASLSALTLGSCVPLAGAANKGFLPVNDEARFQVQVRTPEGTSLAETRIVGEGPSPLAVPPGCPYAARCASADARCRSERPAPDVPEAATITMSAGSARPAASSGASARIEAVA